MNGNIKQTKNESPFLNKEGGEQWNALDETKPWNAPAAAAPPPALRTNENGSQALDFLLGILKDGKEKNPQDTRRSITWDDVDKRNPSVHWTETSCNRSFESDTSYETGPPMVPPLKKRLSSGFARGLALPGWMNGSFLDDNHSNETSYFNLASSGPHATPRAAPRSLSIGSRTSLPHPTTWTVSKGIPIMSEPLLDTPCPPRYYQNLVDETLAPPDQSFVGHRFGGARNSAYSEGVRRGSSQGNHGMGTPFAPRDTGDYMFQYPPAALSHHAHVTRDADNLASQHKRKREHPSEITNLMLDGKLIKVRKVTSGNGIRSGANVLQLENYVTVDVDEEQGPLHQVSESKGSFPSLFTQFGSLGSNQNADHKIASGLQSVSADTKPTDRKPTVSFDTLDQPNKNNVPGVQGCICKRSRCLKLYCKCFQTSNYCDAEICRCKNCHNTSEFDGPGGARRSTIKSIKARRPDAFGVRPTKKTGEGCSCKKNRCLKKYCDCFATGAKCTSDKCTCNDCGNGLGNNSKKESATGIKVSKPTEKEGSTEKEGLGDNSNKESHTEIKVSKPTEKEGSTEKEGPTEREGPTEKEGETKSQAAI